MSNEEITNVVLKLYITHTYIQDLFIELEHLVTSRKMTILNYAGGSDDNLGTSSSNPAVFSDSAENCSYTISPPGVD